MLRTRSLSVLLSLVSLSFLTGCGTRFDLGTQVVTKKEYVYKRPPNEYIQCPAPDVVPDSSVINDPYNPERIDYINRLINKYLECYYRSLDLKKWLDDTEADITASNKK